MDRLGFLCAIGAGLPGEHGSPVAVLPGVGPGGIEALVAIHQQLTSGVREVHIIEGQHEDLVPEDMATVGFAMQAPGGDRGIELLIVGRAGNQQVVTVNAH